MTYIKEGIARVAPLVFSCATMAGCGTVSTLSSDDSTIKASMNSYKTNCYVMPRVYSGVSHNVCKINSSTIDFDKQVKELLYFADLAPSALLDTLVLPYSIYKQTQEGSLALK